MAAESSVAAPEPAPQIYLRYIYRGESLRVGRILPLQLPAVCHHEMACAGEHLLHALAESERSNVDLRRHAAFFYHKALEGWSPLQPDVSVPLPPTPAPGTSEPRRIEVMLEPKALAAGRSRHPESTAAVVLRAEERDAADDVPIDAEGFFAVGVYNSKAAVNVGTLWRSAYQLGAAFIFTIGSRNEWEKAADTMKAWRHVPAFRFADWDSFCSVAPFAAPWVAVELGGTPLEDFEHPERAIYLLGAEDSGLPPPVVRACAHCVSLDGVRAESYNVAVAGSIVMYDRLRKQKERAAHRPSLRPTP